MRTERTFVMIQIIGLPRFPGITGLRSNRRHGSGLPGSAHRRSSGPHPKVAKQNTAQFMRESLPDLDSERQILSCRACGKSTVPVPDPQRQAPVSHCYRCGCEHATSICRDCGAAMYFDAAAGLRQRCDECRSRSA